jgi:hypothetical protein
VSPPETIIKHNGDHDEPRQEKIVPPVLDKADKSIHIKKTGPLSGIIPGNDPVK